jgi:hypothetical protein
LQSDHVNDSVVPVLLRKLKEIFTEAFADYLKEHNETHLYSLDKPKDLEQKFHLPTEEILDKLNRDKEAPWADGITGKRGNTNSARGAAGSACGAGSGWKKSLRAGVQSP